jgi:hypothetical protein
MTRDLEDFIYSLEQMDNGDLSSHALDDVWLAELTDEELIAVIHEMVKRLPETEDLYEDDWLEDDYEDEEEWGEYL